MLVTRFWEPGAGICTASWTTQVLPVVVCISGWAGFWVCFAFCGHGECGGGEVLGGGKSAGRVDAIQC